MSEENKKIESSGNDSDQQEGGGQRRSRGSACAKHQRMVGHRSVNKPFMVGFVPFSVQ